MKFHTGLRSLTLVLGLACALWAADPDVEHARKLFNYTNYDEALKVLQGIPSKTPEIWALIGRASYFEANYKQASDALEKAVGGDPGNSDFALWLGRAYGRRAETSSPFTAPGLASHARQMFEKAVQLNPNNIEALSDLCDYYIEAPGFLGGGMEKAEGIAERMARINPAEGHSAHARIAEKRKEYSSAEDHLRRAIDAAPQQIGRFVDLARLLYKQGRYQEGDVSLARADKVAPNSARLLYLKADLYIRSNRNLGEARELLKRYLTLTLTPDDPPRTDAMRLLKKVQGA